MAKHRVLSFFSGVLAEDFHDFLVQWIQPEFMVVSAECDYMAKLPAHCWCFQSTSQGEVTIQHGYGFQEASEAKKETINPAKWLSEWGRQTQESKHDQTLCIIVSWPQRAFTVSTVSHLLVFNKPTQLSLALSWYQTQAAVEKANTVPILYQARGKFSFFSDLAWKRTSYYQWNLEHYAEMKRVGLPAWVLAVDYSFGASLDQYKELLPARVWNYIQLVNLTDKVNSARVDMWTLLLNPDPTREIAKDDQVKRKTEKNLVEEEKTAVKKTKTAAKKRKTASQTQARKRASSRRKLGGKENVDEMFATSVLLKR